MKVNKWGQSFRNELQQHAFMKQHTHMYKRVKVNIQSNLVKDVNTAQNNHKRTCRNKEIRRACLHTQI